MEEEKKWIKEILSTDKVNSILGAFFVVPAKKDHASIEERKKGNDLYKKKLHTAIDHERIWKFYTRSIALAPCHDTDDLEVLASGYGNRSALLFHIGKFDESIIDIDRALKITKSNALRTKLLDRKAKCQTALQEGISHTKVDDGQTSGNFEKSDQLANDGRDKIYKILSSKAAENPFESVNLRHNEKYGRHLLAKRDFMPGEILMSVKPYVYAVNKNNQEIFCGHCMKTTWTSIPCDHCNWCLFCSEECKQEAWQKYHDVECGVVPYFRYSDTNDYWKQLALRLVVMAIREAGGIAQLREEFKKIDGCKNEIFFDENDRLHSIYNLTKDVASDVLESHADQSVLTLIYIAKGSSLFGVDFKSNKNLLQNEDVVFVGSLFLRFMRICDINAHCVSEGSSPCRFSRSSEICVSERCCERGVCLAGVPSFLNHSCFPNVRKCFTEDMQLVVYALQYIPKNSQLFDSYVGYYFEKPKLIRQSMLQNFNFICNCPACKEDWPSLLVKEQPSSSLRKENCKIEKVLLNNYDSFLKTINHDYNKSDLSSRDYLSKNILKATTELVQPCHAAPLLMSALWNVMDNLFGCKLQFPDQCAP